MEENINNEFAKPRKNSFSKKWKAIFSGDFLINEYVYRQRGYIILLFVLSIIYISNRHIFSRTLRENIKLRKEVARSKAKYVTKSAELVRIRKRSQIVLEVKRRKIDLEESDKSPIRVKSN